MTKIGFDNAKYIETQSARIKERIAQFGGKLYLEFGGKLFDDHHASRVLPGFEPDSKIRMLQQLKEDVEIVIAIGAQDIVKNKFRADLGIPYEEEVLRLIDIFRMQGFYVGSVVVTQYNREQAVDTFIHRLSSSKIRVYHHYPIAGYPRNPDLIVSDEGYGKNEFVETSRPLVVVTAPGPGSGKMATCLSQLYHEHKRGIKAGYAKFETFPIWNLPLKHPVNLAYEAATADLNDVNMIDPYHLEAYGETTVNYNRDVEVFPVLQAIFEKIYGTCPYKSPTDMGVNMAGFCIIDDAECSHASYMEILRRYYSALADKLRGKIDENVIYKIELLMKQAGITTDIFPAIRVSLEKEEATGAPAGAMVLSNGEVVTGKTTDLLGASSALLLNSLKRLAHIDKEALLIANEVIEPVCALKVNQLHHKNPRLHSDEVLIALCVSAISDPVAKKALDQLPNLRGCGAHFSVLLSEVDEKLFKRLGVHVSCEPKTERPRLFF